MELLAPWWLIGIPVAGLLLWAIGRRSRHPMGPWRRGAALFARGCCVALAFAWLAVPMIRLPSEQRAVVFVVDHSASMGDAGWRASLDEVSRLEAELPADVQRALVSAGERPRVIRGMRVASLPDDPERPPAEDNTDLSAALRLAAGLCPPQARSRIVVIGDGWETRGDAAEAGRRLASQGMRVDAVAVEGEARSDVRVVGVESSHSRLHQGASLELGAELVSSLSGEGVVRLFENGIEVAAKKVALEPGERRRVPFQRHPDKRGVFTYRVRADGFAGDSVPANNEGLAFVDVRGQPLLLYLAEDHREARHLQKAMAREGLDLVLRRPSAMPRSLAELIGYDGVIVGNVPAYELGEERMSLLRDYVEQLGGGLVMIGGDQSFGAGGYYRTPIEDALPVKMRAKDKEERRPTCLMLVLDRSGSMGGQKIVMCKQAAKATAQLLRGKDYLGVIAFDSQPHWIVPMGRMSPAAVAAIDAIQAGGGTMIYPAMQQGWQAMRQVRAGSKHMIVLTDGHGGGGDFPALARMMQNEGVTISTVAVGGGADVSLLQLIAQHGGGTCYQNADPGQLKAIFTQDTMKHLGKVIREEPFVPVAAENHPMLKGWSGDVPALLGYVKTEPKATTQVPLVTDLGDPLLAHWRYGLGKVTAFTSGSGSRWAPLWIAGWPSYGRFWAQVLRDTVRPPQGQFIDVHARSVGDRAEVDVDLMESAASFANNAEVVATVHYLAAHSVGSQLGATRELTCQQVAPGRYRTEFPLEDPGVYLVRVRSDAKVATAGLVHVPSRESATGVANRDALGKVAGSAGGELLAAGAPMPPFQAGRIGERRLNLQPLLLTLLILTFAADLLLRRWEHVLGLGDQLAAAVGRKG